MFGDDEPQYIYTQIRRDPVKPENRERALARAKITSRKMLVIFLQEVLPPLLRSVEQLQESLTLRELMAEGIYSSLKDVKRAIAEGRRVPSFASQADQALSDALQLLEGAEKLCGCKEADLGRSLDGFNNKDYLKLVRKRSVWPIGEYRVQFTFDGRLVPKGYIVVNRAHARRAHDPDMEWTFERALRSRPETRRGIREYGWEIRDRFITFSEVPFNDIFTEHLTSWCRDRATICGRKYSFLFDKGAAKPNLWFFAPTIHCTREQYLSRLGSFENVDESKLGDRISLAFTLTKPLVQLDIQQIVAIPEVVNNGYPFSDGCGVMGKFRSVRSVVANTAVL